MSMRARWFVALLLCAPVHAQETPSRPRLDALRETCEQFRAERGIVGIAVAVVERGEVVFEHAFGQRDREAQLAAGTDTLFRLASVSKPVTAAIAMRLVERNELDLEAPVSRWVDGLPEALGKLRASQLLSHTSGIRHYAPGRLDNGTVHRTTAEALALFAGDELGFEPGTEHRYSTHAFTLAVAALEGASGEGFVAQVRELAKRASAPSLDAEIAAEAKAMRSQLYELAKSGEAVRSGPREDLSWKYGGGGLESTAADVARFADAVLRAKVVSEASRDRMWTRTRLADGSETSYGLGWGVSDGGNVVSHAGAQQGASSGLTVLRREGVVIAVLSNTGGSRANELVPRIREALKPAR